MFNLNVLVRKKDTLSDIIKEIGVVFFATVFIEPIITENSTILSLCTGLILSVICWVTSVAIARK